MASSPSSSSKELTDTTASKHSSPTTTKTNDAGHGGDSHPVDGDGSASNEPSTKGTEPGRAGRRGAAGAGAGAAAGASSAYASNKMPHLKKEDGVPLWRKDIQYQFLRSVFEDDTKVFHKMSDGSYGHTFADIYLDAMAQSSKCSKILKDKLLTDRPAAINMAMVCLLVNIGRINTTLNCKLPSLGSPMTVSSGMSCHIN